MKAYINEIFTSIQGEGSLVGLPFIFVRFAECNLRCPYCDTKFSWERSEFCYFGEEQLENPISIDKFIEIISSLPFNYLSFTGGEPLLNSEFIEEAIEKIDKKIFIETNGTLYEKLSSKLLDRVSFWSMDIKLPSLIKEDLFDTHINFINNLKKMKGELIIKAIFSTETEEEELFKVYKIATDFYKVNERVKLIFQPFTQNGEIKLSKKQLDIIYLIMKSQNFEIRLIPQIHKILSLP
ncbi:MAG: 7-carboxy-7-deazaguanine synthase QueE [Brevinematales bacterium]